MKTIKLLLSFVALMLATNIWAQAPESFKYQAVARNASGDILANQAVGIQISIRQGSAAGTAVYTENHNVSTNTYGLINLQIGNGSTVSGTFSTIDWGNDTYFIEVSMDATGGTSYSSLGTSQLLSVPYALHAESASSVSGVNLGDLGDVNAGSPNSNQVLTWNGSNWVPQDQTSYSAGTGISISGTTITNTAPDQTVSLSGTGATTVTGTYPNFSISSTDANTTYSAGTGLTLTGTTFSGPWTISSGDIYRGSGNVGIGNSTPAYKLDILHNSSGATDNVSVLLDAEGHTDAGTNAFGIRSEFNGNGAASNFGIFSEMTGDAEATGSNYAGYFNIPSGTGEDLMAVRAQVADGASVRNYAFYGHSEGVSATFNIGGIYIADGVSANTNYGVYSLGDNTGSGTSYAGYFDGDVTVTGTFSNPSDRKLKTNISTMESAIDKVKLLDVKSYEYINNDFIRLPQGQQFGFIAQDLEAVFPNLVNKQTHIKHVKGEEGKESFEYKAVNYIGLVPVLTKAIQEQQALIEKQQQLIEQLDARLKALENE